MCAASLRTRGRTSRLTPPGCSTASVSRPRTWSASRRLGESPITAPTLVIHGTADPMFPVAYGEALAREIPGARLLRLEGAGHGVDRADWEPVARAIIEHTSALEGPKPHERL